MPYFERKSWQESFGKVLPNAPTIADDPGDIATIAQSILASGSTRKHATEGPFCCRKPVRPGEAGVIVLQLDLEGDAEHLTLNLSPDDLRARGGATIPGARVEIDPGEVNLAPGSSASFEVRTHVPHSTKPGTYRGRVFGSGPAPVAFIVEYEVIAAE